MVEFAGHQAPHGDSENLQADEFYPAITTQELQQHTRNDAEPSATELSAVLQAAIYAVNADLYTWRATQTVSTLGDVQATAANFRAGDQLEHHYRQAVFARAKAEQLKQYRDTSTTGKGHQLADGLDPRIGDYQAQAWRNVRAILGCGSLDAELI